MRFLLDEGVPVSVGTVLQLAGHDVIFFNSSGLAKGSPDVAVCAAAEQSGSVLVAADHDMKRLAKGRGITPAQFKRLGLVRFECSSPSSPGRTEAAISLIEHEWQKVVDGYAPRLFVTIGESVIRTFR